MKYINPISFHNSSIIKHRNTNQKEILFHSNNANFTPRNNSHWNELFSKKKKNCKKNEKTRESTRPRVENFSEYLK